MNIERMMNLLKVAERCKANNSTLYMNTWDKCLAGNFCEHKESRGLIMEDWGLEYKHFDGFLALTNFFDIDEREAKYLFDPGEYNHPYTSWYACIRHIKKVIADYLLQPIRDLGDNWDSYGAEPIDADMLDKAYDTLRYVIHGDIPAPQIAASAAGDVQFEWHEKGHNVELYLDDDTIFIDDKTINYKNEELHKLLKGIFNETTTNRTYKRTFTSFKLSYL